MIPSDTQSLEELPYAFSRFIIQGEIIAHMVLLDVHYMLYYLIQKTPKTQSTIYPHQTLQRDSF